MNNKNLKIEEIFDMMSEFAETFGKNIEKKYEEIKKSEEPVWREALDSIKFGKKIEVPKNAPYPFGGLKNGSMTLTSDAESFIYEFLVPGFRKEELEVSIDKGILFVKGVYKDKTPKNFSIKEFSMLSFDKPITLPVAATEEVSLAKLENGILTLVIKKKESPKPTVKKVTID